MTQPLHLGLLTSDLTHLHGWAHYSLSLLLALRRAGIQVTVIAARNSPAVEGVSVLPILPNVDPFERGVLVRQMMTFSQVRRALAPCNLIHSTIEPYAPLAALVAGSLPLVVTGHGSYVRMNQQSAFPASQIYERALRRSLLVCVSRYTARQAQIAMPGIETTVVNNGIDLERFEGITPHQPPDHHPTILFVGAVKARKGVLALVHAIAQVRQTKPDVQCVIIGSLTMEPDYVDQVQSAVETLNLQDSVHLLGRVPDDTLKRWYGEADVFVLPSLNIGWKFEGYGLSLMEASAAGLPVIGTTDCGAEDAVEDGVTGLLVSQSEIERELPQAILRLLDDPALARRMGDAGRIRAQTHTWDHVAEQMIGIYQRLVSGKTE